MDSVPDDFKKNGKISSEALKYLTSGEYSKDQKFDVTMENELKLLKEYIKSEGGFNALAFEEQLLIKEILEDLTEEEKEVVQLYLGILFDEPNNMLEELKRRFNLSDERVEQIKKKALEQYRKKDNYKNN